MSRRLPVRSAGYLLITIEKRSCPVKTFLNILKILGLMILSVLIICLSCVATIAISAQINPADTYVNGYQYHVLSDDNVLSGADVGAYKDKLCVISSCTVTTLMEGDIVEFKRDDGSIAFAPVLNIGETSIEVGTPDNVTVVNNEAIRGIVERLAFEDAVSGGDIQ